MFNFFSPETQDGVAFVAAFMGGVAVMVFGYAGIRAIMGAIKVLITPSHQMAKRN